MKKSLSLSLGFVFSILLLCIVGAIPAYVQDSDSRNYYPPTCQGDSDEWVEAVEAEDYVLTRLNQWRLNVGVAPLERNSLLNRVAAQQLNYIRVNAPFSMPPFDDHENFRPWHTDVTGGTVLRRLERNGWPRLDNGVMVGSEIAAYYPTISQSINFWQRSPVHNRTATLGGFREVGIHTQCWHGWLLTYVVMASRPDTLTVAYDPHTNALYFGDESHSYSGDVLGFRPDFYQIQDLSGRRMHADEWLIWNDVIQVPPGSPQELRIIFTDGVTTITKDINLRTNRIFPSQSDPTATPTWTPTATSTVGPSPTAYIPTATFVPTTTPDALSGSNYDLVLYYNQNYITIVNETGQRINLEPLGFTSDDFPIFEIGMSFLAQPFIDRGGDINNFPPNSCVQAFSGARFTGPGEDPISCIRRVAYRNALEPSERFWLRPNFEITYGLQVIAGCPGLQVYVQESSCGFDLPDFALTHERTMATPLSVGGG
jgi:uncharacterized protein YkwD